MSQKSLLDDIARRNGTDKSSEYHNYCVKYEKYLPFNRYDILNILEIGVFNGESLRMWKDYFYRSQIIGIDVNPDCKKHEEERIVIEIGSQNDEDFLHDIIVKYEKFDLIIDDGSHINNDVMMSFAELFDSINHGGVYVVEDSFTSYWQEYGGGYKKRAPVGTSGNSGFSHTSHSQGYSNDGICTMEYFKDLVDRVNFYGEKNKPPLMANARREDYLLQTYHYEHIIESINFLNGLIMITKR